MTTTFLTCALAAGVSVCAMTASAATMDYRAILTDLNGIGASGQVDLRLDTDAQTLAVRVRASGLAPDMTHIQHIHGVTGGDSKSPPPAADTDGDGFIELLEGVPFYGPIILSLTDDTVPGLAGFPTAPGGEIDFSYTYDLIGSPAFNAGFGIADLLPLQNREIVIHGAFTDFGREDNVGEGLGGGILNDPDGGPLAAMRNYNAALPVLSGEISAIPLPAAGWLLLAGFGGLGALARRRA